MSGAADEPWAAVIAPGSRVDDYEVLRRVAIGASSEVFEARHLGSGRAAAVKVLHAAWCLDAELVARFLNEARALQAIQHPRIVIAHASGVLAEGPPFMILEWLPVDLHRVLARAAGGLPACTAARIAGQVGEALAALHERGIVHRDLKPANVLLTGEEPAVADIKLADLGLAKVRAGAAEGQAAAAGAVTAAFPVSTGGGALLGTWDYMPPEQWIRSKDVDAKADVYALGVLLFQMLSGTLPFIAEQPQELMSLHLFEEPPLARLEGVAPAAIRALIARMLSKKASARPAMAEIVAAARAYGLTHEEGASPRA